jgi:selenocysteine lyase/cysteine desulfurase
LSTFVRSQVCRHSITGYQAIGSFHSENPEILLRIPSNSYHDPPLPFQADHADMPISDFMLDKKWTFLNHGAFGACLSCVYRRAEQWRLYLEKQPLRYFDRDLLPHMVYTTRRLAQFLGTSPTNLALLPNVTAGMNSVMKGYKDQHNQGKIVLWETSYGSVKKMARIYCPDRVHEISFLNRELHSDPSAVMCSALQEFLSEDDWSNSLLIMDHTASNAALNFPIPELATIAKKHGMIVCVDGAHGLLAQPVHEVLPSVDIYLSNGHKWLCCPRGVALLYCASEELRETILRVPAVVSHGIDDGYFNRFVWDGTRDYAPALAVPAALDYWESQGPNHVRARMRSTLTQAVELLADMWHDGDIERATLVDMQVNSPMALVRLPSASNTGTSNDAKRAQDFLFRHCIEVPVKSVQGNLYVRLSCHVYNELHEYERLGNVMLQYSKA